MGRARKTRARGLGHSNSRESDYPIEGGGRGSSKGLTPAPYSGVPRNYGLIFVHRISILRLILTYLHILPRDRYSALRSGSTRKKHLQARISTHCILWLGSGLRVRFFSRWCHSCDACDGSLQRCSWWGGADTASPDLLRSSPLLPDPTNLMRGTRVA